jgi:hypothetical protein
MEGLGVGLHAPLEQLARCIDIASLLFQQCIRLREFEMLISSAPSSIDINVDRYDLAVCAQHTHS